MRVPKGNVNTHAQKCLERSSNVKRVIANLFQNRQQYISSTWNKTSQTSYKTHILQRSIKVEALSMYIRT